MGYGYGRNNDGDSRSDSEVARSGNVDSGYCNRRKIKAASEERENALSVLRGRGYSEQQAENMISGS